MEPRFIADGMLGKLAKWLRILGCDVEFFPKIPDDELADRVEETGRVLLTRDTRIIKRRKVRHRHFFVRGDDCKDQLRQVVAHSPLDPERRLFSRCVLCNEPLVTIEKAGVEDRVPPYVYLTQDRFRTCASCGRIYWPATHHDGMARHLKELLEG
ncbi:MAG: Mut7-C RNAse domain-containing protein [Deltaproteobacteria bacterium]|nr:Mut7-C RNAse domain-containing protein [Deltaproteobacteria bacterium]